MKVKIGTIRDLDSKLLKINQGRYILKPTDKIGWFKVYDMNGDFIKECNVMSFERIKEIEMDVEFKNKVENLYLNDIDGNCQIESGHEVYFEKHTEHLNGYNEALNDLRRVMLAYHEQTNSDEISLDAVMKFIDKLDGTMYMGEDLC